MNRLILPAALAATLAGTATAAAHAQLERAVPAVGSTVAAPDHIALFFSEGVVPGFSGPKKETGVETARSSLLLNPSVFGGGIAIGPCASVMLLPPA